MRNVLFRYLSLTLITLIVLSFVSFSLAYLFPGHPIENLTGLKLDDLVRTESTQFAYQSGESLLFQYWHYMVELYHGNWGYSFSSGLPLYEEIAYVLPASIELSAYALMLSIIVGIPLGFLAALHHHKIADYFLLSVSVIGYSIPVFWLALLIILIFSLQFGLFPLSGRISLYFEVPNVTGFILIDVLLSDMPDKRTAIIDIVRHLFLPTLSIAVVTTTLIIRITRRSVIETMNMEFIKAAYARGLSSRQVIFRHGIRNALIPIFPLLAMQFTTLLTNAMIVETIFSWPGLGNWLIQAIYHQDYPAIRAGMLTVSVLVVVFTMSIELTIRLMDPKRKRLKHATI
ncbi:ABC transporter permease subunit [Paraglaciecola aquimarina]|uniref:ABC transporter permease subunit n=1 Tax=Paraglaciecola aquimarina TaxID=1235557 RepID=A0ABU3T018_9ALTE|nr:ABC transporter permease subunit [Paraglaciecola aquimarina]MDU0355609.1 ABC transporter permease subunit [Paraglaciecola aquimarina]